MKRNEEYIYVRLCNCPGHKMYQNIYESGSGVIYVDETDSPDYSDALREIENEEDYNSFTGESIYDFIPTFEEFEGSEDEWFDLDFKTRTQIHQRAWDAMKKSIKRDGRRMGKQIRF